MSRVSAVVANVAHFCPVFPTTFDPGSRRFPHGLAAGGLGSGGKGEPLGSALSLT